MHGCPPAFLHQNTDSSLTTYVVNKEDGQVSPCPQSNWHPNVVLTFPVPSTVTFTILHDPQGRFVGLIAASQ